MIDASAEEYIGGCFAQVTLKVAHTPVGNLNFGQFSSTLAQGGTVSYAQEWAMGANITGVWLPWDRHGSFPPFLVLYASV